MRYFGVVYEALALVGARRHIPCQRILQALDDGRLSTPILADDQRKWRIEDDSLFVPVVHSETSNAADQQLLYCGHGPAAKDRTR